MIVSHNMNDVFEVADRIAVLHLGRMVAVRPIAEVDRQIVVDLMTTGDLHADRRVRRQEGRRDGEASMTRRSPPDVPDDATRRRRGRRPSSSPARSRSTCRAIWTSGSRAARPASCPVVAGLLLVSILFQSQNDHFLTAGNLVNLLVQAAVFSLLAMGEVYALLLGEIDLSIGFVAGLGGVVMAELAKPTVGLALVGGDRRRVARLRADRAAPGHADHPDSACRRSW